MYQLVPASQSTHHRRIRGQHNRNRLESTSKHDHHQPLQPHDDDDQDYISDSSEDSNSMSSTSSFPETRQLNQHHANTEYSRPQRRHHRNYQHITQPNKSQPPRIPSQYPNKSASTASIPTKRKSQTTITRRSMPQTQFNRNRHKHTNHSEDINKAATVYNPHNYKPPQSQRSAPPLDFTETTTSKYKVTILVCFIFAFQTR